ncbi:MAG: hypothetical protein ABI651_07180 [Verrucomicrobiota bacterium]
MNPRPDDFQDLQRLLRWKRHEKPPPGYFDGFSSQVIAEIEASQIVHESSWWERFFMGFDAKPALVCAYSLVVCSSLLYGLGFFGTDEANFRKDSAAQAIWFGTETPALPADRVDPRAGRFGVRYASFPLNGSATTFGAEKASLLFDGTGLNINQASYPFIDR